MKTAWTKAKIFLLTSMAAKLDLTFPKAWFCPCPPPNGILIGSVWLQPFERLITRPNTLTNAPTTLEQVTNMDSVHLALVAMLAGNAG